MTPTFSLGCGTWGGSTTTDNVNYRNLLNIKAVSRRQSAAAVVPRPLGHVLQRRARSRACATLHAEHALIVTDAPTPRRAASPTRCAATSSRRQRARLHRRRSPEPTEEQIRAGVAVLGEPPPDLIVAVGGGSVIDAAKAMRLFHESPEPSLRELTLPFLDARKRVAHYPEHRARDRARRGADDGRHGLGGLARGGAHRTTGARSRSSTTRSCPTWRSSSRG